MMRLLKALVLILALGLVGCGSSSADRTNADRFTSSPGIFRDDFGGSLASNGGDRLWLAETGTDRQGVLRTKVFALAGRSWRGLPGQPRSSYAAPVKLAVLDSSGISQPCLGFSTPKEEPRVRCFTRGGWQAKAVSPRLRKLNLVGMGSIDGHLFVLFHRQGRTATTVQVAWMVRNKVVPYGKALHLKGQVLATLGEKERGLKIKGLDIALERLSSGARWVATLRPRGWSHTGLLTGIGGGPQLSGPGRVESGLINIATDAERSGYWPLTAHRWAMPHWVGIGDGPLNVGPGNAQGTLNLVDGRAWITWVQHVPVNKGLFPTTVHAAMLDAAGESVVHHEVLWKGRTIGPGPTQAVEYNGSPGFLYMRQWKPKGGLHVTVSLSE